MEIELSLAAQSQVHNTFMAVATEAMQNRRDRRHLERLQRNGFLSRHASQRAYARYQDDGGEVGTGQGFFEWIVANWSTILKMIMDIIGLFGGMSADTMADAPQRLTLPPVDVELVAKIAGAVETARKAGSDLIDLIQTAGGTIPGFRPLGG